MGMDFITFCRMHGVVIDCLPPVGRWKRFKTEDKPHSRNGAVKWMGDHGHVQNHATMTEVASWRPDDTDKFTVDHRALAAAAAAAAAAERERAAARERAARKAQWILDQCQQAQHAYLERKGFKDERGLVWITPRGPVLVVPMRVGADLVGCQLISEAGEKKFLSGQRTTDAAFVIGHHGAQVLCEGYATGLSVRVALAAAKVQRQIVVTFSANNLKRMARPGALVVADNDASGTGERVARETGLPYWLSDTVGEDFNDFHQRAGLFRACSGLRSALFGVGRGQGMP